MQSNDPTPVKSPKKAAKQRPKVLDEDESYKLFVSVYLDRHAISKVLASSVKDLKVVVVFYLDRRRSTRPFRSSC